MNANTISVDGVEVYLNNIYSLADEFIQKELNGSEENVHDRFMQMIFYIADRIEKPDHDNIELLDEMFNVFIRLCVKYEILPTVECFSFLVKINRATFGDWRRGEYRATTAHGATVEKWIDTCRSFTVDRLHNSGKTDVNLIFISKAAYGMRETAPEPAENLSNGIPKLSREEIAARYAAFKEEPGKIELN